MHTARVRRRTSSTSSVRPPASGAYTRLGQARGGWQKTWELKTNGYAETQEQRGGTRINELSQFALKPMLYVHPVGEGHQQHLIVLGPAAGMDGVHASLFRLDRAPSSSHVPVCRDALAPLPQPLAPKLLLSAELIVVNKCDWLDLNAMQMKVTNPGRRRCVCLAPGGGQATRARRSPVTVLKR